jgi:hypothetical protein
MSPLVFERLDQRVEVPEERLLATSSSLKSTDGHGRDVVYTTVAEGRIG